MAENTQAKMTDYGVIQYPRLDWQKILGCDFAAFVYARLRDGFDAADIVKMVFDASVLGSGMDEKTLMKRIKIGVSARVSEYNRR